MERETGRKPGRMSGKQLERDGDRERQAGGERDDGEVGG